MNNEKVIVALLLIAILLSVVTLAITFNADVHKNAESVNPADLVGVESADVQLNVLPNPAKGGSS